MSLTTKFFLIIWIASLQSVGIKGFKGLVPPIRNGFIMDIYKMPLAKILDDCPQELELNVQFLLEYVMSFHNTINQLIENIRDNTKVDWDNFSKSSSCLLYLKFNENYFTERLILIVTKCSKRIKQKVPEADKKSAKDKFHERVCSAIQRGVQDVVSGCELEGANGKTKE